MYYALIGSKNQDNDGQVVIFRSEDLRQWSYVSSLDRSEKKYGGMWECPDLFELDGKDVLITSPQFMEADGLEFHNGNGTLCIIGRIDEQYRMCRETLQAVDYGLDFYAPQTLKTADSSFNTQNVFPDSGFIGMRQVRINGMAYTEVENSKGGISVYIGMEAAQ